MNLRLVVTPSWPVGSQTVRVSPPMLRTAEVTVHEPVSKADWDKMESPAEGFLNRMAGFAAHGLRTPMRDMQCPPSRSHRLPTRLYRPKRKFTEIAVGQEVAHRGRRGDPSLLRRRSR